jgi:NADPH-dependent 2,4-dienoyl-CoA reductase/sulfur reductase-like enzyme
LIGSPLGLASTPHANQFWTKFDEIVALRDPSISVTQGSAVKVNPTSKTATILDTVSGREYEEKYDYLIAASGLRREKQVVPQEKTKDKYLIEAAKQIAAVGVGEGVKNGKGVVVIGGGKLYLCSVFVMSLNTN